MKNKIKKLLKKVPLVNNYVEYRNCAMQYGQLINEIEEKKIKIDEKNHELEKALQDVRKKNVELMVQHNSNRMQQRLLLQTMNDKLDSEALREDFFKEKIEELCVQGNPLVSIIVLNRNGVDKLQDLMNSFEQSEFYSNYEIIFVDNASTDTSVEYMKKWKEIYSVRIIENKENQSFSVANNRAAAIAKGEYLLFLNNDVAVTDGWLDELILAIQNVEKPGAIGAQLIYPDVPGKNAKEEGAYAVQHQGIAFRDSLRQKQYFTRPYNLVTDMLLDTKNVAVQECIAVTAAVLMVSKSAFEVVGGFSEEYFYGLEDVDFCLKLSQKGYRNYYCPRCVVYHYEFGTRDKGKTEEAKKRNQHNGAVFQGKWQKFLVKKMLLDKLEGNSFYTKQQLQIAFACGGKREDVQIKQLERYFAEQGYEIVYLDSQNQKKYYNAGLETDVLFVFDSSYDIDALYNKKNDLIRVYCVEEGEHSDKNVSYDYCTTLNSILKKPEQFKKFLLDYTRDDVDEMMVDICGCMPGNDTKKFWGDLHFAEAMKREFEKKGYRANVLTRDQWYCASKAKYIVVLRGNREYYPSVEGKQVHIMWNISHPDDVTVEEYNSFDYVFFASKKLKEQIGGKLQCETGVLMQCTDEQVMRTEETTDKKYELLFVGNSRHIFRQVLKDLLPTEHKLTVYGRHWEEFPVQQYVEKDYVDNDKVGQVYQDAMILLNDHWEDMKEQGIVSNRIFDALAAGAFVISDYLPEIDEIFDGAVVTYRDKQDLHQKIDYYMEHADERIEKAKQGQKIVLSQHTFSNRVAQIIAVLQNL